MSDYKKKDFDKIINTSVLMYLAARLAAGEAIADAEEK